MLFVPENKGMKPMEYIWQEIIVSVTPGFAAVGALLSASGSDRFGRKKVIVVASIVFTVGAVICGIAWTKPLLAFGRILLGIAIGFASMIVPVYVSEVSPSNIRGRMVTGFQLMITIGLVVANVFGGAFSYIDPTNIGWRLMFGFAAIPAVIQFICFLFLPESPRWLFEHNLKEETEVLKKVYNGDDEWVQYEMAEIRQGHKMESLAKQEHAAGGSILWRIAHTPHVRKALFIGSAVQAFQQLSGINTVMYYTGKIIQSSGVTDPHLTIWITVGTSTINFLGTLVPMALIERIGRRVLFMISVTCVIASLLAMGTAFLMINRVSSETTHFLFSNCDFCVTNEACGFCEIKGQKTANLTTDAEVNILFSKYNHIKGTTYEWDRNSCKTSLTVLPIIIMVLYLLSFSIGFAPLPWVVNAEFYPLWARSTCVSITTAFNWTFNLIISLTFLSLSQAITKFGTFYLYAGLTFIALIFICIFVPETRGYSIDEVEMLFMTKEERQRALMKHEKNANKPNQNISVIQLT
uniref:MFS domain-containing protein n=1 Tax=Angiostrongylus cantonensis TaxID=6313 RepID=A0A0K0CVU2_ANGCA